MQLSSKVLTVTAQKLADAMLTTPCVVSEGNLLDTLQKVETKAKGDLDAVQAKGIATADEVNLKLNQTLEAAKAKYNGEAAKETTKHAATVGACRAVLSKLKVKQQAVDKASRAATQATLAAKVVHTAKNTASKQADARHLASLSAKEEAMSFRSNATARGIKEAKAALDVATEKLKKEHDAKSELAAGGKDNALGECDKLFDQSAGFVNGEKAVIRKIQSLYAKLQACTDKSLKAHPPKQKLAASTALLEVRATTECHKVRDAWRAIAPELDGLSARMADFVAPAVHSTEFLQLRSGEAVVPLQGILARVENQLLEKQEMLNDCQTRVKATHKAEKTQIEAAKKVSQAEIQKIFDDVAATLDAETKDELKRVDTDIAAAKVSAEDAQAKSKAATAAFTLAKAASDKLAAELEAETAKVNAQSETCTDVKEESFVKKENALARLKVNQDEASQTAKDFADESLLENEKGVAEKKKLLNIQLDLVQSVRREASKLRLMRLQKRVIADPAVETDDHVVTLMKRPVNAGRATLFGTIQLAETGEAEDTADKKAAAMRFARALAAEVGSTGNTELIVAKTIGDMLGLKPKRIIVTYNGGGVYGYAIPNLSTKQAYDAGDVMQATLPSTFNQGVIRAAKALNLPAKGLVFRKSLVNVKADKGVHTKGTVDFAKLFDEGEVSGGDMPTGPTGPAATTTTTTTTTTTAYPTGPTGATGATGATGGATGTTIVTAKPLTTTPKPVDRCILPNFAALEAQVDKIRGASKEMQKLLPDQCVLGDKTRFSVDILTIKDVLAQHHKVHLEHLAQLLNNDAIPAEQFKAMKAEHACGAVGTDLASTVTTLGAKEWGAFKKYHDSKCGVAIKVEWRDLRDCLGLDENVKSIPAAQIIDGDKREKKESCMPEKELATMLKCSDAAVLDAECKKKDVTEEMFTSSVGDKAVVPQSKD
jgi:hypothetical protein